MSKYLIKDVIISILREEGDCLMNAFMLNDDFRRLASGDQNISHPDNPNRILMMDTNVAAGHAFLELLNDGVIELENTLPFVAMGGGDIYRLPIYDPRKRKQGKHWYPAIAVRGPHFPDL